ncbi:MAG: nitrilase-related carbon-nitrogen hydrolase [Pseudomonadota bacterium]
MSNTTNAFHALALQTRCRGVNALDVDAARAAMLATIARIDRQIGAAKRFIGSDTRLVVLPEYFLSGFPMGESIAEWCAKAALADGGPEYRALAGIAERHDVYLAGNAYETDPHFPGLYFQACFVFAPSGARLLTYRRLVSMFAPTPHDVLDRYIDVYGVDALFPVVDSDIGRLAAVASEEILYPEITRALALRGAEVIVHSTSEIGSPDPTPKDIAKRARAFENSVYVVSANSAGIDDIGIPAESTDGMSKIVDYQGRVLASAGFGESIVASAELDIAALRRWRRRPGMSNVLSRQRTELIALAVEDLPVYPANTLLDADGNPTVPERGHFTDTQRKTIAQLAKRGLI